MNGVQIDRSLKTEQTGVALHIVIIVQTVFCNLASLLAYVANGVDIVVNTVGKKCELCREMLRREIHAEVSLQTVLSLQVMVALLIALCAVVNAVRP